MVLASLKRTGPPVILSFAKKALDPFIRSAEKAGLADVTFHCLPDAYISRLAPVVRK